MKLSILMIRKDRPFYNWCELKSLSLQHFPKDEFEVICMDDSTTAETPKVFKEFSNEMNIKFYHFDGWDRVPQDYRKNHLYVGPTGKKDVAMHMNYGLARADGDLIFMEWGEFVHMGETLLEVTGRHDNAPNLVYYPAVRSVTPEALEAHMWHRHPEALWTRPDIWGEYRCPPGEGGTDITHGMMCSITRKVVLERLGGCEETWQKSTKWDICDEELARRIHRSDCIIQCSDKVLMASIDHDPGDSVTRSTTADEYRGKMRSRRMKDSGWWGNCIKFPYYRPGTEKQHLIANRGRERGAIPPNMEVWNLDETLEKLR
jgi:hypothetical protein